MRRPIFRKRLAKAGLRCNRCGRLFEGPVGVGDLLAHITNCDGTR